MLQAYCRGCLARRKLAKRRVRIICLLNKAQGNTIQIQNWSHVSRYGGRATWEPTLFRRPFQRL
jgi:hypothetical protein